MLHGWPRQPQTDEQRIRQIPVTEGMLNSTQLITQTLDSPVFFIDRTGNIDLQLCHIDLLHGVMSVGDPREQIILHMISYRCSYGSETDDKHEAMPWLQQQLYQIPSKFHLLPVMVEEGVAICHHRVATTQISPSGHRAGTKPEDEELQQEEIPRTDKEVA
jgi:hypothetical protein